MDKIEIVVLCGCEGLKNHKITREMVIIGKKPILMDKKIQGCERIYLRGVALSYFP